MSRRYLLIASTFAFAREARVAADQLAAVDPDVPRTIIVVDEDPRSLALLEAAGDVVTGHDIGLDLDLVGRWAGAYGPHGIVWAAFPHLIRAVGEPGDRIFWIGADLDVAGRPDALWDALEKAPVVAARAAPSLAPHGHDRPDAANGQPYSLQPVTAVVQHGGELIARSVLGWVAGDPALERVLAQWPVPRDHPTHEPIACNATVQQWFNALALESDVSIVRSPGVVLSIAQLLSREVTDGPNGPLVDGSPLSVMALRGFDAFAPHLLEGRVVTARVSDRPALAPVLRNRAAALLANGWTAAPPATRWDHLDEGLPLTDLVRDLVRGGLRSGAITHSPFTPEGFAQLRDYATQPARQGGSIGVNRLLGAIHTSRVDLHSAYPALDGPDGLGFLGWAWVHGRVEMSIPESFLPPRPAFLDAAPPVADQRTSPDTEGVNLAGYFTSELGLGESARQIAAAMEAAGVATTPVQGLLVPPTRQQADFVPVGPQDAHHDVNVVVVNGDQMPHFARDVGEGFFEGRPTIAVWWWEVDPFPAAEWAPAMEWVDEIWVGTEFIRGLIEPHVDVPVWVFPVPVAVAKLEQPVDRAHFGFSDDETIFLFVWDYHSTESRKNPSGLVEAYRRAFPDDDGSTRLVLKCINHENLPEADEKVRLAAAGRSDITFIDRFLSGREKNSLLELCDCYVSPHRSEGFGYTPAEAMLLNKPVVVTAYGGTTEYTDDTVARMIKWTPAQVGRGALPYPPDGTWADPDLDDLADALRWIVAEPEAAAAMAARGKARVEANHNITTTGGAMRDRLRVVRARQRPDAAQAAAGPATAATPPPAGSAAPSSASLIKRTLKVVPGAQTVRSKWWRMQDRSVASRTAPLRADLQRLSDDVDVRIHDAVTSAVTAERAATDGTFDAIAKQRDDARAFLEQQLADLRAQVEQSAASVDVNRLINGVERQLGDHLTRHGVEPYGMAEAGFTIEDVPGVGKALGASELEATGDQYADFLAVFRGPYDRILELMQVYGPLLQGHGPLLDIGSGRGELLEVAESVGIEAKGIDLDVELVRQSVERGRTAVVGDGIAALRDAPEGSLGSVSAIHVVEHLPVDDLEAFFREALKALRPGGMLLSETINPHEVSAASTFWVDVTHRGPVFPEVALALALSSGFRSAHVFAPDGTGDWEHDRTRSTRYTLIARR